MFLRQYIAKYLLTTACPHAKENAKSRSESLLFVLTCWPNYAALAVGMKTHTRITTLLAGGILGIFLTSSCLGDVTPPPGAPSWWNSHDSPYWTYHEQIGASGYTEDSAAAPFVFSMSLATNGSILQVSFDFANGYAPDLYKQFYIWLEGSSSGPASFVSITAPNDSYPDSVVTPVEGLSTSYEVSSQIWQLSFGGIATPQPDREILVIDLPLGSTVTHWELGEQCMPIPEPAAISLLALAGILLLQRRSRR
jgi:hypothetical protein